MFHTRIYGCLGFSTNLSQVIPKNLNYSHLNTKKELYLKIINIQRKYRHYIINIDLLDLDFSSIGILIKFKLSVQRHI